MKIKKGDAYLGDCLDIMDNLIEQGIQVDAIITDPPYGTTACKRDTIIPFDKMRERLNKLIKPNGAIVLFGSEPFSSALRMSNIKNYKYDWIRDKVSVSNPQLAKIQPLKHYETISSFSLKKHNYYPQGLIEIENKKHPKGIGGAGTDLGNEKLGHISRRKDYVQTHTNYPKGIIKFNREGKTDHPTQKPVALIEYLVKTYSLENDVILDFTSGSGTTGIAAQNTNRQFILIEKDKNYYDISLKRLQENQERLDKLSKKDII